MSVTELKPAEAPPSERSRWIALVVLCVGMLMIVLDQTIVNVALPSIQRDLNFSTSSLAWVVNAYLIAFGGLLLLAGRLGDLVGRKRMFLIGLAVFTVASALCGLADSQALLVGARFVQGAGGAMTSSVILGMIVTMFPEPREQAKAMGVFSFVAAGGASIGLLAGGVLTQALDWHWIFFVNLPIGVLATLAAVRVVTADQGIGLRAGADLPGATLVTAALMLAVYTIVKTSDYGWGSAHTLDPRRRRRGRPGRLPGPRGDGAHAAHPPADLPQPQRLGRQPGADADDRRHLRDVLPGRRLHAAGARLRPAPGGPGLPAGGDLDRDRVAVRRAAAQHEDRPAGDAAAGPGPDGRSGCCCSRPLRSTRTTSRVCCR